MDSPQLALDLLLADNAAAATPLALKLAALNERRQADTKRIFGEAELQITTSGDVQSSPALVVADPSWSIGIAGIVAGRLADRYHRPTIVFEYGEQLCKGSGRSSGSIDLVGALRPQSDLLDRFGGHQHAAGLTLPTKHLDEFRERFNATVLEMAGGVIPGREIRPDAEVCIEDLNLETVALLETLEPFGEGNPYPSLFIRAAAARWEKTSADGKHLFFSVVGSNNRTIHAVFFGEGKRLDQLRSAGRIDIAAELKRDEWEGRVRAKLYVTDFRPA
jgi:single-stranded-DNA-specific exonuclease